LNRDQIGAELGKFGDHELMQSFADRCEQDHRRDADRNSQAREKAAHPVRQEA
jgi:hypothetical protein